MSAIDNEIVFIWVGLGWDRRGYARCASSSFSLFLLKRRRRGGGVRTLFFGPYAAYSQHISTLASVIDVPFC